MIDVNAAGTAVGDNYSYNPAISDNGNIVAFETYAGNLVAAGVDGNGTLDVYVRDRSAGTTTLAGATPGGSAGNSSSNTPVISGNGTTIAFNSYASNLVPSGITDTNATQDVFAIRSVGVAIDNVTVTEGNSSTTNAVFTVTLLAASAQTVTVDYTTVSGTATAGTDFVAQSGTLTFAPGETSKSITILVNGDTTAENNETFTVLLSNATNADIAVNPGLGTILNDDTTISVANATIAEGDSNTTGLAFTVTLSVPSNQTVTVDFATSNNTAAAGSDYVAQSGTLTFAPGETSKLVTILVNGDTTPEPDETFFLNLNGATNGLIVGGGQAVGTIQNDDAALSIANVSVIEGGPGATTNAVFTVTIPYASTRTVTVDYATANGTATAGSDFTATSGTLTFAPGETVKMITVVVNGDATSEGDETFSVTLGNASNAAIAQPTATGTILNDDTTISVNDATVIEGNSNTVALTFTVSLSAASAQAVTVDYATANNSAVAPSDFAGVAGTLTFAPGETSKLVTVLVNGDTTPEFDETLFLNLSNPTNATFIRNQGVGTIRNDDASLSIGNVTQLEGNAQTTTFNFTVSLPFATTQTVTVDYATADGSATAGSDYVAQSGTLTFAPGETFKTIAVVVNGDTTPEPSETFTVNLSNPTGATLANPQGLGTILNDDTTVSVANAAIAEGDSNTTGLTFTVTLSVASNQTVTVNYATANNTAAAGSDYVAQSGTLSFAPGETSKLVTILVNGDTTPEPDETFFLNLSGATNGLIINGGQGIGTIQNDDAALTISDAGVLEGNSGTTNTVFNVTIPYASTRTVTVDYATANGTATAGGDFVAQSGTLTFAPGETFKTITVVVNGDTTSEGDETFTVTLSNPGNATISRATATGTILDDDVAGTVQFFTSSFSVGETDGSATITVTRSGGTASGITVQYATTNGSATAGSDYTGTSGTLSFGAGETIKTFVIPILDDGLLEGNETVNLQLSSPGGGATLGVQSTAVLTIVDDEVAQPGVLQFSGPTYSVGESGVSATITVTRTGGSDGAVTVQYATANGSATAGSDYTGTSGTLSFGAGETTKTFTVAILDDGLLEGNETVNLQLSGPGGGATLGVQSTAVLTIVDDEVAQPGVLQFSGPTYSVGESGVSATITVTRTGGSDGAVTVQYATANGSATAGSDYTGTSGTLSFGAGETTKTFTVAILDDGLLEGNETVNLQLSGPGGGATLGVQSTAVLTIVDDEVAQPGVLQFSGPTYSVGESGVSATITVTRTGGSDGAVSVQYATANGSATAGSDYTGTSGTLSFGAGETIKTFVIPILDDTVFEGDETVNLNLSSPGGGASLGAQASAVLTILDDETPPNSLMLTSFDVQKGAVERSFVRYVDIGFNQGGDLDAIVATVNDTNSANDRIRVISRGLDGTGNTVVPLASRLAAIDKVIEIDFGSSGITSGIGGNARSTLGDGYYEVQLDLDDDGTFETTRRFYRLFGDVDGNQVVDIFDIQAITNSMGQSGSNVQTDVDGDGLVNALDRSLAARSLNRKLTGGFSLDD